MGGDVPEVFVVRRFGGVLQFHWEIRRFGGVVLDRSDAMFSSTLAARSAGTQALTITLSRPDNVAGSLQAEKASIS